jgi:heptosyltransferase-3
MTECRNILVVKSRHIGDVLLTGPLCSALKRRWPGARVTALVKPGTEAMLRGHTDVDEVLCFPEGAGGVGGLMRNARFLWGLRQRDFDLALNTTEGDRGLIALKATGAPLRAGIISPHRDTPLARVLTHPLTPRPGRLHTVQRNLELLDALPGGPVTPAPAHVALRFDAADAATARTMLDPADTRPLAVIHAVSRWTFKTLPAATVAAAVDRLHALGAQVLLTAGPGLDETLRVREIAGRCATPPRDLAGRLGLKQLAALLAHARLFIGVDSAPMHMAAALDVPVVAVFGPSGAFDWGPWPNGYAGPGSPYPGTRGPQRSGPHWVLQDSRDCVPCGKAGCHDSRRSACLEELPAAQLVQTVTEAWQQAGGRRAG